MKSGYSPLRKSAMHITEKGHQLVTLKSLDELKGYSLKKIEAHPRIPHGGRPIHISLKKGDNDMYRIDDYVYKELKHSYLEFEEKDSELDSLIETIDSKLKEIPPEGSTRGLVLIKC